MNESFPSPESIRITDEQAIEALQNKDARPESQATFEKWLDQAQEEIDRIYESEGSEAAAVASIKWAIKRATVYYRAGFTSVAIEDLTETCDAASSRLFDESGLHEEAVSLLERIKVGEKM